MIQHDRALQRFVNAASAQPDNLAIVVTGSLTDEQALSRFTLDNELAWR